MAETKEHPKVDNGPKAEQLPAERRPAAKQLPAEKPPLRVDSGDDLKAVADKLLETHQRYKDSELEADNGHPDNVEELRNRRTRRLVEMNNLLAEFNRRIQADTVR